MGEIDEIIAKVSPYYKKKKSPETEHTIVYDSSSETLEPIYFYILDMMGDFGLNTEKLIDNFTSSPGSGHFAELGQRATIMQQQASKMMGDINTVLRSIMNLIYDLKEFKTRLDAYESLDSKDENVRNAAMLSLKQIWMDKVDITKGNSAIKAMALGQAGFATLIDAFLASKDEKEVKRLDLNDRVKRILLPRIQEFNVWVKESRIELEKRYKIERTYLKSQVNSLKIYSRWAKPYFKAARELEQKDLGRNPDLVRTFNTMILELALLGKSQVDIKSSAIEGSLPKELSNEKMLRSFKRGYNACVLVDFNFRGVPQRIAQQSHYAFGGKAKVTFKAYALNDDEIKKLNEEMEKSDVEEVLRLLQGVTEESLEQLQGDIDYYLEEDKKEEKKKEKSKDQSNPFLALIGAYDKKEPKKEKKEEDKDKPITPDNFLEKEIRKLAATNAVDSAFNMFDVYKKAHGMESYT